MKISLSGPQPETTTLDKLPLGALGILQHDYYGDWRLGDVVGTADDQGCGNVKAFAIGRRSHMTSLMSIKVRPLVAGDSVQISI